MTALALVPTLDVDTTATHAAVADQYVPGTTLTVEQAQIVTARISATLAEAQILLRVAFQGRAHEVLGYGTGQAGWEAYFAAHFAGVVLALPVAQRQDEVAKWNAVGASARATATALGVSLGTVSGDRKVVGQPDNVRSLDGRQRDARAASRTATDAVKAKPVKALTTRVEELLLAAGATGMTSAEVGARLRVGHNRYSPTVTRLEQQRRIVRTAEKRAAHSVFMHPAWLVAEDIVDAEVVD